MARGGFEIVATGIGVHIAAFNAAPQTQLLSQVGDEFGVAIAFGATEPVIEMGDDEPTAECLD
jgi:hypothetical protein